jgi:hypothetical protein
VVAKLNPGMVFIYVSGAGTDSSEKGSVMWARVKGRTENELVNMGFRAAYNFRPGLMRGVPGQQNIPWWFKPFLALYPLLKVAAPNHVSTLSDVARAMLRCVERGYEKPVLEVRDINALGSRNS